MTYAEAQSPGEARRILWNQFILARALARTARLRCKPEDAEDDAPAFFYTDTHAGSGRLSGPLPYSADLLIRRHGFSSPIFFDALRPALPDGAHPGSWVLAGRVLNSLGFAAEIDVNDIDQDAIRQGQGHREYAWTRFWSHDWFQFLRSRLSVGNAPDFVFIDPPPDDPRGPVYAQDAAILLDTLNIPYMISYPAEDCQEGIDQIGRTGLELSAPEGAAGVLLGGGAESVLLELLADLKILAPLLGGEFMTRTPRAYDYSI
ncbi:MAG TPA: hypothetical protein VM661_17875 [Candidatus Sulfotelmatobacter sp.]|jgi:hypothetical protein|nr:hypothetical protein [Candidatus Sulfotelmatobacter sp.]